MKKKMTKMRKKKMKKRKSEVRSNHDEEEALKVEVAALVEPLA
jgi:hypothetical protein